MTDKGTGARVVHWVKRAGSYWLVVLAAAAAAAFSVIIGFATNAHEVWKTFFEKDATKLFVTCQWGLMPTVVPPEGRIHVVLAYEVAPEVAPAAGGGFADYFSNAAPGSTWKFTNDGQPPAWAYKCAVSNYSTSALFNVVLHMRLTFRKPLAMHGQDKSLQQGPVTQVRPWMIKIDKLDAAPGHDFVFYVWNCCTPRFVHVELSNQGSSDGHDSISVDRSDDLFSFDLSPIPFEASAATK